jgi:hypothetical protein
MRNLRKTAFHHETPKLMAKNPRSVWWKAVDFSINEYQYK